MSNLDLQLQTAIRNPALFRAWGNYLERRIVEAFKRETAPTGAPWQPLKPATIRRKRRAKGYRSRNKILRDTGALYDSIATNLLPDGVEVGTGIRVGRYSLGAIHQYGAPRRNIPPRPFLPLDPQGQLLPQDASAIQAITEAFLRQHLR